MSAISDNVGMAPIHTEFAISLSVRKDTTSLPTIRAETALNGQAYFSNDYPRGRVWQSAVWPEELRQVQHVSVTIDLGPQCASRDRIAMNHTFAGLINFLDAASSVGSLRIQVPNAHHFTAAEVLEVIQPAAILVRCRPEVAIKLVDVSAQVADAAVQARRSHSRNDDTIEKFYSRVRVAARAAGRLHQAGLHARIEKLNCDMAEIMAEVGFVGVGIREKVESAIEELDVVLVLLLDGL